MSGRRTLLFVVAGAVSLMTTAAVWADRKIPESEVPKVVLDAVKTAVPKGQFVSAEIDEHHHGTRYEINVKDGDVRVHLHVNPDGTITWLVRDYFWDDDVPTDQVPPVVKDALKKLRPNAEILDVDLGHHHGLRVYEIEIRNADGEDEEIFISDTGDVVKVEAQHRHH